MSVTLYGKVFYKGRIIEAGIEIENGVIKKIGKSVGGRKVRGLILPASIDVHVHFRDFDERDKETIETGSLAALHGGVCLVVDQPNTKPLVDSFNAYKRRMEIAKRSSFVDYSLNLALTNENFEKIDEIVDRVEKRYFLPAIGEIFIQHNDKNLQIDYEVLKNLKTRKPITIHAEDPELVKDGFPNFKYRLPKAEIVAVKKCLSIGNYHFCHISTFKALKMISESNSTCEIAPHHFLLSIKDYERLNGLINVNPPLRDYEESKTLLKNLCLAEVIASDHAPHTVDDKIKGSPGFPGVETLYPMLVYLISKSILDISLIEKITKNPAKIFGFKGYGKIEVGNYANLAIFNLKRIEEISCEKLHSKADWTPFEGFKAIFPEKVYIRGVEALDNGEILIEKGFGRILTRI